MTNIIQWIKVLIFYGIFYPILIVLSFCGLVGVCDEMYEDDSYINYVIEDE